jgi:hypothetical protein
MHYLVLALIIAVGIGDQLTTDHILPKPFSFVADGLSALVVLYVVAFGARQRFQYVRASYWLVFGTIAAVVVCGAFANDEAPGPLFAGIRFYCRALPLFFLPAVYEFKTWQIRQQLRLLLLIGVLQLPFAGYQRWIVMRANRFSGDSVVGTLADSSVMSMYLICAVCILTGFVLRRRISKLTYFVLFFYLLAATAINETKGTLILLPFALLAAALVGSPPAKRIRMFFLTIVLFAAFLAGFAPIYDYMQRKNPYFVSIEDFFTNEKKVDKYLEKHSGVGTHQLAGRVDSIVVPLRQLSRDPAQLAFGLGIGNASHSSLGPQFIGAYNVLYSGFLVSSFSIFLLEIGVFGTALVFVLYWLILVDSLAIARTDDGFMGAVASGWAGITVLMTIATPYITTHIFPCLSYLFWYFSGLIAAMRMRTVLAAQEQRQLMPASQAMGPMLGAHRRRAVPGSNVPHSR